MLAVEKCVFLQTVLVAEVFKTSASTCFPCRHLLPTVFMSWPVWKQVTMWHCSLASVREFLIILNIWFGSCWFGVWKNLGKYSHSQCNRNTHTLVYVGSQNSLHKKVYSLHYAAARAKPEHLQESCKCIFVWVSKLFHLVLHKYLVIEMGW